MIEIDGSQHYTEQAQAYDSQRTAVLQKYGIKVIRFSNNDINNHFRAVCNAINQEVESQLKGSDIL